jgi:hypothetical protein
MNIAVIGLGVAGRAFTFFIEKSALNLQLVTIDPHSSLIDADKPGQDLFVGLWRPAIDVLKYHLKSQYASMIGDHLVPVTESGYRSVDGQW